MHLLVLLVQLSLALGAIGAHGSPPKAIDEFRAIASDESLGDAQKSLALFALKKQKLKCFSLSQESAGLTGTKTPEDFKTFHREAQQFERFATKCEPEWTLFVERAIGQWGVIGEGITNWMDILESRHGHQGRSLENLFDLVNPRHSELHSDFLASLSEPADSGADGSADGSAPRPTTEQRYQLRRQQIARDYLKRAYFYGDGICNQLDLDAPYGDFLARFGVLLSLGRRLSRDEPTYSFLGHKLGHKLMQPDKSGQYHSLGLLYSVKILCAKLKRHKFPITQTGPLVPNAGDGYEAQLETLKAAISWIWQRKPGTPFTWEDRYQLKQYAKLMQTLERLNKVDYILRRDWFHAVKYITDEALFWSLRQLKAESALDWSESVGQASFGDEIVANLDWHGKITEMVGSSLISRLGIRGQAISQIENLFIKPENSAKLNDEDRELRLESWLTGGGYCDLYLSPSVHKHPSVFDMLETLNDLASIPNLTIGSANRLTRFFYMWRICQQARVMQIEA